MPDAYWPYLAVVAGGLALWGVAALHGWLRRRDAAWQPARPGDTPGELVPGEGDTADDLMAVAEHLDVDPQPIYQPCGHRWHDARSAVAHIGGLAHRCVRLPDNDHARHICRCGAAVDADQVVLVVDPPVVPPYIGRAVVPAPLIGAVGPASPQPDDETWVTFRGYRVHRVCPGSLRGHVVRDGCAAHLNKAGVA